MRDKIDLDPTSCEKFRLRVTAVGEHLTQSHVGVQLASLGAWLIGIPQLLFLLSEATG